MTTTASHNLAAVAAMRTAQATAAVTGTDCPECGGGVNPTILAHFGHCLTCQNTSIGR